MPLVRDSIMLVMEGKRGVGQLSYHRAMFTNELMEAVASFLPTSTTMLEVGSSSASGSKDLSLPEPGTVPPYEQHPNPFWNNVTSPLVPPGVGLEGYSPFLGLQRGESDTGGSSRGSGSFDLPSSIPLAEPLPDEEGEAISRPNQNTPIVDAGISDDERTEDSFAIGILCEPFSESEAEDTSVHSAIPTVAGESSSQGSVV